MVKHLYLAPFNEGFGIAGCAVGLSGLDPILGNLGNDWLVGCMSSTVAQLKPTQATHKAQCTASRIKLQPSNWTREPIVLLRADGLPDLGKPWLYVSGVYFTAE